MTSVTRHWSRCSEFVSMGQHSPAGSRNHLINAKIQIPWRQVSKTLRTKNILFSYFGQPRNCNIPTFLVNIWHYNWNKSSKVSRRLPVQGTDACTGSFHSRDSRRCRAVKKPRQNTMNLVRKIDKFKRWAWWSVNRIAIYLTSFITSQFPCAHLHFSIIEALWLSSVW